MRSNLRFIIATGVSAVGMALIACSGSTTAPTSSSMAMSTGISPTNNAVIRQNDPASGCALLPGADVTRGFGYNIQFRWTAASLPSGVAGYEIYATKANAVGPTVDLSVRTTDYTDIECNAFITDSNLDNWEWRVRAKDAQGQFGEWSAWSTYQFAPCRLSDGTPCHIPN